MVPQLGFGEALSLAFSRIGDMKGRSRRSEFWWTMLALFIAWILLGIIVAFISSILSSILCVALFCAFTPLMCRRMHDVGKGNGLVFAFMAVYVLSALCSIIAIATLPSFESMLLSGNIGGTSATFALLSTVLMVVYIILGIICIVFWAQDSQGPNQYGPSPKYPEGKPQYGPQQQ